MASLWQDEGTWIALGASALFVIAGIALHRFFVNVLKAKPMAELETSDE